MQYLTALREDLPQIKKLWSDNFEDGTAGFCDFLFSYVNTDRVYIAKEDGRVASMLIAAADLEYKGKKGFYLYSACTDAAHRKKGYMHGLVKFCLEDMREKGRGFCVVKPANRSLFDFYRGMGFTTTVKMRNRVLDIPKNIWQSAEFDIATASRMRELRDKFSEGDMVHYTSKDYEKYAVYLYSFGGSTAENNGAFAVYYTDDNRLTVKEILARDSVQAMKLLQAIRERTGFRQAEITLSRDSNLFLGEGRLEDVYLVQGTEDKPYINLMFE